MKKLLVIGLILIASVALFAFDYIEGYVRMYGTGTPVGAMMSAYIWDTTFQCWVEVDYAHNNIGTGFYSLGFWDDSDSSLLKVVAVIDDTGQVMTKTVTSTGSLTYVNFWVYPQQND